MRLWKQLAIAIVFVPVLASAQYKDLDSANSNISRGLGSGDTQAIIAGVGDGDQVMLQFPGLVAQNGFFGRDQAAYFLEGLFNKVKPSGFESTHARGGSATGQYTIDGMWTTQSGTREVYITLQKKGDRWVLASIKSGSGK
jgi:hypothetical protein